MVEPNTFTATDNWREVKLAQLGRVERGRSRHRPRHAPELYGGSYPFIQTGDIKASGGRITSHTQTYSEAGLAQSRLWPVNTLAITIAANIAETAILTYPACFPDSVVGFVADESECDVRFVEYVFRHLRSQIQHEHVGTGSVQDNINLRTLDELRFLAPPLPEQQAIAHVLGTLDDKIELNRRMNRTLEAMARAIFQDWFVDFGPTRAKMEGQDPYLPPELWNLFPDELMDSELGEIPEGWGVATLNLFGEVVTGKTPSTRRPEFYGVDVPFLKIPDMHGKMYVVETQTNLSLAGAHSQQAKTLPPESVSVSCIATPGLVVLNHRPTQTNQQINSIVPNNEQTGKYIYWVCRRLASEIMLAGSGGSVFHNMNKSTFSSLKVLKPTKTLINSFSEMVAPIHSLILSNETESRNLSNQREALLPELLSGQMQGLLQPPQDGKGSEHHHPTKAAK